MSHWADIAVNQNDIPTDFDVQAQDYMTHGDAQIKTSDGAIFKPNEEYNIRSRVSRVEIDHHHHYDHHHYHKFSNQYNIEYCFYLHQNNRHHQHHIITIV